MLFIFERKTRKAKAIVISKFLFFTISWSVAKASPVRFALRRCYASKRNENLCEKKNYRQKKTMKYFAFFLHKWNSKTTDGYWSFLYNEVQLSQVLFSQIRKTPQLVPFTSSKWTFFFFFFFYIWDGNRKLWQTEQRCCCCCSLQCHKYHGYHRNKWKWKEFVNNVMLFHPSTMNKWMEGRTDGRM